MKPRRRRPTPSAASKAAATLSLLGASAGGKARKEALTPERRKEISDAANAAQGKAPGKPWWEVPQRTALTRHRCALHDGWIKKGEPYFDRGSNPRKRACVPCVERLMDEALSPAEVGVS